MAPLELTGDGYVRLGLDGAIAADQVLAVSAETGDEKSVVLLRIGLGEESIINRNGPDAPVEDGDPDVIQTAALYASDLGLLTAPVVTDPLGHRDRTMLEVLYATGLRVSELVNLKHNQVNLNQGVLRIVGKGNRERLIPLGEEAVRWLQQFVGGPRTEILLERGWSAEKTLGDALVEGMRIVGIDFRDGILFVPEVLLAANAMKAGMEVLRPLLSESDAERMGKVVIGTVKGDIHDIGKNLVAMMLEGAGFEVIDLGINNPVENYLAALDEHKPEILGMSALLTTTMPYMKVVIDTLEEQGRRDDVIVLVGGAPLNEEFGKAIGADAYCRDAAVAADTAKRLVLERRGAS